MVNRAVFLDRDGVLNANVIRDGRPVAPETIDAFRLLPGVPEAAQRLKEAGFLLVVVTNQPDIGTGRTRRETLEAMHDIIRGEVGVDDIKTCVHVDADHCDCRKPKPGMILAAAAERDIDLSRSYMVGDRWRDIDAGRAAGCLTIFVDYRYKQESPALPDKIVGSLSEAADFILETERRVADPMRAVM
ncbi:MAG: HAD family hydrolase [Xanthobacteraceae bacterium]